VTVSAGVLDIGSGELAPAGELVEVLDSMGPDDWIGVEDPNWLVGELPGVLLATIDMLEELDGVDVDCISGSGGGGDAELTVSQ
jgi:hypothetical protein